MGGQLRAEAENRLRSKPVHTSTTEAAARLIAQRPRHDAGHAWNKKRPTGRYRSKSVSLPEIAHVFRVSGQIARAAKEPAKLRHQLGTRLFALAVLVLTLLLKRLPDQIGA